MRDQGNRFKPGFRFSLFDAIVLILGVVCAAYFYGYSTHVAYLTLVVTGHFFLFCNVFRISRHLEFIWSIAFIILATAFAVAEEFTLIWITVLSLLVAAMLIGYEMRQPLYHGVLWKLVNPKLPEHYEKSIKES